MSTSLSARNVRVVRNGAVLLDDVSIEARAGELVAVLGPNGAGKSTLLGAIAGDFPLSSGAVEINGRSLADYAPRELA
ncbi:MAG: ATP-binding cassette domain-containing protein, partial [Actinobacteria bacterium]|nr:ATP-binding cassette domain-containing protein [Actinomycetota bacterium]